MKRKAQRIYHERLLELLGNKCVRCGFSDSSTMVSWGSALGRWALQIDHISGGGRKELGKDNEAMYRYYLSKPDEAKLKLQVLCANCNIIKRHVQRENAWNPERKVCPECGSPARHKRNCSKAKKT